MSTYFHRAGWSSLVARQAHNLKVAGSNPAPATNLSLANWRQLITSTFFKMPEADFTLVWLKMWREDCNSTIVANRAGQRGVVPGAWSGKAKSHL